MFEYYVNILLQQRGITNEIVPTNVDKSLLQSSLTSDLESNIYYSYSEFNETSTSNIGKTITSGSRDINNINSFVTG